MRQSILVGGAADIDRRQASEKEEAASSADRGQRNGSGTEQGGMDQPTSVRAVPAPAHVGARRRSARFSPMKEAAEDSRTAREEGSAELTAERRRHTAESLQGALMRRGIAGDQHLHRSHGGRGEAAAKILATAPS